jgi:uncharacterized protein (TIGR02284 family)
MQESTKRHDRDIDQLNSFRRGELAAVETYDQALEKLGREPRVAPVLRDCRDSHQERAAMLRREIEKMGGKAANDSGAWGSFAQMVEGSAKPLGKKAAIAALEEGEDHGRDDYRSDLDELSPDVREFVQNQLLPEQLRTHQALSDLKHAL